MPQTALVQIFISFDFQGKKIQVSTRQIVKNQQRGGNKGRNIVICVNLDQPLGHLKKFYTQNLQS